MRNRSDSYRTQIQSALLKLLLCWNFRIRNRWGCCHVVTGPDVAPIQVVYAVYLPTSGLFIWQFSNFLPKMPWWSSDCNAENSRKLFRLFFLVGNLYSKIVCFSYLTSSLSSVMIQCVPHVRSIFRLLGHLVQRIAGVQDLVKTYFSAGRTFDVEFRCAVTTVATLRQQEIPWLVLCRKYFFIHWLPAKLAFCAHSLIHLHKQI